MRGGKGARTELRLFVKSCGYFSMADARFSFDFPGKLAFLCLGELVTMPGWPNSSDSGTSTASPASSPGPRSEASSATPGPSSSPCSAAEKNALRGLRAGLPHLLRQAAAPCPRPVLWRQARLSRLPGPQGLVPPVRRREARTARLARRQPAVHQALRLLRGPAVPRDHGQGGGRGTSLR